MVKISEKVVAIVQARMGSTRLPGKMLLDLAGQPLIDHVLARLQQALIPSGPLDVIVMATGSGAIDDPLAAHVVKNWPDIVVVRGSEQDVLARFLVAIEQTKATVVIRATGDCPLINAPMLGTLVSEHCKNGADVTNYRPGFEYADKGLEIVSAKALKRAAGDINATAGDREHVTSLLYRYPESYQVYYLDSPPWLRRGDVRLTVDTPEDLMFFQALCNAMDASPVEIDLRDALVLLDQRPELISINAGVGRKSTLHERARIGFRCDGGAHIGLGHIVGSLRFAKLVARELGVGIEFVCRQETASLELVRKEGRALELLPANITPAKDIDRLIAKAVESNWSALVINFCKDDLDVYQPHFQRLKESGIKLIFMDNPVPPGWRLGDVLINALPHPDYPGYDPDSHPACLDGLQYFLPDSNVTDTKRQINKQVERVLIAMGGGDTVVLTEKILAGLSQASFNGTVDVVVGAAARGVDKLSEMLRKFGLNGRINQAVNDLPERMAAADLGFTALGLTTYEMAFSGLPALIVANSAFNSTVAEDYCRKTNAARFVGGADNVSVDLIETAFLDIAEDVELRRKMALAGQKNIGGRHEKIIGLLHTNILTRSNIND